MKLDPEQALLRAEARALTRPKRGASDAGRALEAAFTAYLAAHGLHAAGAWASAKAGPLMAKAHPRGVAETAARARADRHFKPDLTLRKVDHAQEA